MLPLLTLFTLLPLLALAESTPLAGNEHYARDSRRLLRRSLDKRWSPSPSFGPESLSFDIGGNQYLSPTGAQFKAYTLDEDWGLDGYKGHTVLATVFDVEGEVTCDTLGKSVSKYASTDDVWNEVSKYIPLPELTLLVFHAGRHPHVQGEIPRGL